MVKYFILFNGRTNLDVNLKVESRPSKPSPQKRYEEVEAPKRDGLLYRDKGYGDIEISISFNFISKTPDKWDKDFRRIKKWLLENKDNTLKFSDDLEVFYKVNKVTIETPERILRRCGKFNVTFTCDPYTYYTHGKEEVSLGTQIYNFDLISRPIYRIVGEGLLTLNINGKNIKANVGQELIIDTDKGLCYRDGIINNVALKGNYQDMYLLEGENTFSWNNGFDIYIIPNWRCL
ncbi:distal tail protein Dit [Clostridium paraputrificum]|uniref:distal tail protein Dit n=1 Tax=Clostridium paraputrificum TaxID=29363 RepID=UPI00232B692C|nr:distal tail protein Dit [Clostridium paraputrificum]MDB2122142.1 phage tail family protein [Clostridium paraputrificum]